MQLLRNSQHKAVKVQNMLRQLLKKGKLVISKQEIRKVMMGLTITEYQIY